MKKRRHNNVTSPIIAAAFCLLGLASANAATPLTIENTFGYFNVYVINDITYYMNTDFQGTSGAGGNVAVENFTIYNLENNEYAWHIGGNATLKAGRDVGFVEVGGDFIISNRGIGVDTPATNTYIVGNTYVGGNATNWNGGSIWGDLYAAGNTDNLASWIVKNMVDGDGNIIDENAIYSGVPYTPAVDTAAVSNYFLNYSTTVSNMADTGSIVDPGWGTLTINAESGVNVYSIQAWQLSQAGSNNGTAPSINIHSINVNGPEDAIVYINVRGSGAIEHGSEGWYYSGIDNSSGDIIPGQIQPTNVLLNYEPAITSATLNSYHRINILAPTTTVNFSGGLVVGNLIVGNLNGHGQVNIGHFNPITGASEADHFLITHDGFGINCVPETISVSPKNSDDTDFTGYEGTIVLNTQTGKGSWSLITSENIGIFNDATANDGLATYTFSGNETFPLEFALEYTEGAATFDIDVYSQNDTDVRDDDTEGDISFSPSGFILTPVPNSPLASADFSLTIKAFGVNESHPECGTIETYAGDKPLQFWYDWITPDTGTRNVTIGGTNLTRDEITAAIRLTNFTDGQATVSNVNYSDVGRINISVKDMSPVDPELANGIRGGTNIVVRPANLILTDIIAPTTPGNCAGGGTALAPPGTTPAVGDPLIAAGTDFCVTVTAVDVNGNTTPNFGQEGETVLLTPAIVAAGDTFNPAINPGTGFSFSNGVGTGSQFSWGEVGIITLTPSIGDGDYLGEGDVTGTTSNNVGRFVPFNFTTNPEVPLFQAANPNSGFTYIGQGFDYAASSPLSIGVTAINAAGQPTQNYAGNTWFRLTAASMIGPDYAAAVGNLNADGLPPATVTSTGNGNGQITQTTGNNLFFERDNPVAPFDADIGVTLEIIDADDVSYSSNPVTFGEATASNGIGFVGNNNSQLFGRLRIGNAIGSALLDLNMPAQIEFFTTANEFTINPADIETQGITLSLTDSPDPGDPIAVGDTCIWEAAAAANESGDFNCGAVAPAGRAYTEPPAGGNLNVWLRAPQNQLTGSLSLSATTAPPYLLDDTDGDGVYGEWPWGTATFGLFNNQNIYLREIY